VLVIGDVMIDQFIWGRVERISPEAPVPVVHFERESFMPGGAANVARNLTALKARSEILGIIGQDEAGTRLQRLLGEHEVGCEGLLISNSRPTSIKTRIIAHQQQVVRVDRERCDELEDGVARKLLQYIEHGLPRISAIIVGDYGKGVVGQQLLDGLKALCRARALWLSLDPKPVHHLNLAGLSLITPNRKEAFELAGMTDGERGAEPLEDNRLLQVSQKLLADLQPALLLITLGDQGMLLCQRGKRPFHIPTVAQEVFDVSGAGDTVIASFTLAVAAGASPIEAAIFSNHAAGVVVGKVGTATVTPEELLASFRR
jgi:D-beta-D-heptose 7-phosphate kinase/D-beta-D-heptose 1-phosphate adenosyltransferase